MQEQDFQKPPGREEDHLDHLLVSTLNVPWYQSLVAQVKELLSNKKEPPLVLTSKPVPVKDLWIVCKEEESTPGHWDAPPPRCATLWRPAAL